MSGYDNVRPREGEGIPPPRLGGGIEGWPEGAEGRWTLRCHRTVEAVPVRLGVFRCPACGADAPLNDAVLVVVERHLVHQPLHIVLWDGGLLNSGPVGVG